MQSILEPSWLPVRLESENESCSVMSNSLQPHRLDHQAPLSMGFSRQGYWSGSPFPSPEDLPDPGIKLRSPALQADSLLSETPMAENFSAHSLLVRVGLSVEFYSFQLEKEHLSPKRQEDLTWSSMNKGVIFV